MNEVVDAIECVMNFCDGELCRLPASPLARLLVCHTPDSGVSTLYTMMISICHTILIVSSVE